MRANKLSGTILPLSVALLMASCHEAQIPLPPMSRASEVTQLALVQALRPPPADGEYPQLAGVCNIEQIDDVTGVALDAPVRVSANSAVSGWRALTADDGSLAAAWLRATQPDGTVVFQALLSATGDRPDVVAFLNRPSALRSGFRSVAVTGLPPGESTLEILLESGDSWVRCAHSRALVVE